MTLRAPHSVPVRLSLLAALMASLAAPALAAPGDVVISQVYGGGGNSGATIKNDFIELFNRSNAAVDLSTWSVQYASSTGNTWQLTKLTGTIQPGQYYLVQESAGTGGSVDLPQADASGTLNMSGTAGKVVLVSSQTALSGTAPNSSALQDVVGFGSATNFSEGSPTANLSASTAAIRNAGGCTDTNNNAADFTVGGPVPRNSASPIKQCSGGGTQPAEQPIALNCPASIGGKAGTAFAGLLQASDPDSIVNGASISSGARAGITLTGFSAAAGIGGSASAQLSVDASVGGGNYPVVVTFANNDGQTGSCTVNVLVSGEQTIPALQGSGATSPFNNTVQTTTGVITKLLSSGYYIQDPEGDGDPTTPDAIYVYTGSAAAPGKLGDLVRVTGTVTEYTPTGAPRSYTEIKDITASANLGTGKTVSVTNVVLGNDDLRRYEGMLVRFGGALTVNGNAYLGDRGELVLGNGRLETATNRYRPNTPEARALAAANERNMVVLDDNSFTTPAHIPYLGQDGTVRAGDTVNDLVGVLDFGALGGGGGWYKLQPTDAPSFSRTNVREDKPTVAAGNVRVASANVLNFFTTFTNGGDISGATSGKGCTVGNSTSAGNCRGADNMAEFIRQRDKIVKELKAMDADAVGLMEIQNNGDTAVSYLVDQLNAATAPGTYAYVPKPPATGTDAIRVAMIYKPSRLSLVGGAMSDNDSINNRPPMAQTFKVNSNGAKFSMIVNHLKSKGSCGGGAGNTDSGDGQGCWNLTRVQQATRLATYFIPAVVAASGDPDVLAVGDFNSYGHEDPIAYLTGTGMVNELERFVRGSGTIPYSYVFDGTSGYLDHALASSALDPQVTGVTEWHNNADEPEAIDYNLGDTADDPYVNNAFRASDHDPVVVSLNLAGSTTDVSAGVKFAVNGVVYNRVTGKFGGTVVVTNTSGAAINGPLQFVLQGLSAGVTLDNKSGDKDGAPYITLPAESLAPGASLTVGTTFTNPSKTTIVYSPKLYTGTF